MVRILPCGDPGTSSTYRRARRAVDDALPDSGRVHGTRAYEDALVAQVAGLVAGCLSKPLEVAALGVAGARRLAWDA